MYILMDGLIGQMKNKDKIKAIKLYIENKLKEIEDLKNFNYSISLIQIQLDKIDEQIKMLKDIKNIIEN